MPRANAMVPPDAIRIEDEVWQEAFTRREPARRDRSRRLEAIDGGRAGRAREQDHVATPRPRAGAAASAATTFASATFASATPAPTAPVAATPASRTPASGTPARRTIKIQGRGAERNLPLPDPSRRRPSRRPYERAGFRPDRLAMWAVVLGFLLVMIAVVSGHG